MLVEKHNIREKIIICLQNIKKYRETGLLIINVNELYLLSTHISGKSDFSKESLRKPISKWAWLIMIHASEKKKKKNGFVSNILAISKASQSSGDYLDQMNGGKIFKRVKEKLVPNLEPVCCCRWYPIIS